MKAQSNRIRTPVSFLLFALTVTSTLLTAQAPPGEPSGEGGPPKPLVIVAGFLQLSEAQVAGLVQLRQEVEPGLREIFKEIKMREERLGQEVESEDPDAGLIGVLVLQIRELGQEAGDRHRDFVETFAEELDEEQQGRLHLVMQASQIQQILPAFHAIGLVR